MKTFEASATVKQDGEIRVAGVPFAPGTEVEVTISPKRKSAAEFAAAWQRITAQLRSSPGVNGISDDENHQEIEEYRAGQ